MGIIATAIQLKEKSLFCGKVDGQQAGGWVVCENKAKSLLVVLIPGTFVLSRYRRRHQVRHKFEPRPTCYHFHQYHLPCTATVRFLI